MMGLKVTAEGASESITALTTHSDCWRERLLDCRSCYVEAVLVKRGELFYLDNLHVTRIMRV